MKNLVPFYFTNLISSHSSPHSPCSSHIILLLRNFSCLRAFTLNVPSAQATLFFFLNKAYFFPLFRYQLQYHLLIKAFSDHRDHLIASAICYFLAQQPFFPQPHQMVKLHESKDFSCFVHQVHQGPSTMLFIYFA